MYKFLLRQRMKKGFTIVELVIVIAVIAILSAILIPTFVNISKSARVAADQAAAKNMNEILAIATAQGKKVDNMTDVLKIVNDGGYVIENLNPTAQGYHYVWDSESNQILYLDAEYNIAYSSKNTTMTTPNAKWWTTIKTAEEFTTVTGKGISVYLAADLAGIAITNLVSIDTGYNQITGTLSMTSDTKGDVILRGKFATVTIDCKNANVDQYGTITDLTVKAVAATSFHAYGQITALSIVSGRLEVAPSGTVGSLTVNAGGTVNNKGQIATLTSGTVETNRGKIDTNNGTVSQNDGWVADKGTGSITKGTAKSNTAPTGFSINISVGTAAELENIATAVNNGANYADCVITLTADIDLTNRTWTPIGEVTMTAGKIDNAKTKCFTGTFDGNNHKIIGLSNNGYVGGQSFTSAGGTQGAPFALFNAITGKTTIKNLTVDCRINAENGVCVAGIVGILHTDEANGGIDGDVTIDNCKVTGEIAGKDKVGGIIGTTYISGKNSTATNVTISNCSNSANITGLAGDSQCRVGGIAGTSAAKHTTSGNRDVILYK